MCHKFVKNKEHLLNIQIKFRWPPKIKKRIYHYQMSPGEILEFYNSATMYLTHNIHMNKVKCWLFFIIFFYCIFMMEIPVIYTMISIHVYAHTLLWQKKINLKPIHQPENLRTLENSISPSLVTVPWTSSYWESPVHVLDIKIQNIL